MLDLSNPPPSIGWLNEERKSLFERIGEPDLICCLALMHHIINAGIPIEYFIRFLTKSKKYVIVEYIPISDPKCQIIFNSRGPEFHYPSVIDFEDLLFKYFKIEQKFKLKQTNRILYLLKSE